MFYQHASLAATAHRPWPLPKKPWLMAQRWSELLFAHWPVPVSTLRSLIPEKLEIDTFDGMAWIGVVPFYLHIRPRWFPVIPGIASFPEINVRTYVTSQGKPGVWFFSLDATSPIAVRGARWKFDLPYFNAQIKFAGLDETIDYHSQRQRTGVAAEFKATYRPISAAYLAESGSLDQWLTERYCLYAENKSGTIYRTDVHHCPWPLQKANCDLESNSMTAPIGVSLEGDPILHFSKSIEVINWLPEKVG